MKPVLLLIGYFLSQKTGLRTISEDFAELLIKSGYSVITASNRPERILRLANMLSTVWRERNNYGIAFIDTYSGPAFLWAECVGFALRLLHKPFIVILHGGDLPQFAKRWPGRVTRLLKSASVVTSPSPYLKEEMQIYRADIKVIPNPLDLNAYHFCLRESVAPKMVWMRAFHRIYNPSLAPRMLIELKKQGTEGVLTMVGPDKGDGSLAEVLQLIDQLKVSSQLKIVSCIPKDQVPSLLSQGDIFINTTNVDNTPVSVIEAMACGLCVVSTNVGGIPYLLEDGIDALLVPPDNPESLASAVCRILSEPDLATSLSINARKKVEQFDWSQVLPKWESIFQRISPNG